MDSKTGFAIHLRPSENGSGVELVEDISVNFFRQEMLSIFSDLPKVVENRIRDHRLRQKPLSADEVRTYLDKDKLTRHYVSRVGQDLKDIAKRLDQFNPSRDIFIVDSRNEFAPNFAKLARRHNFKVIGIGSEKSIAKVKGFTHFDEFLVTQDNVSFAPLIKKMGIKELRLDRPIGQEVYVSFHTRGQKLEDIEMSLQAIAKQHPGATLVSGFLPESQIHYLPQEVQLDVEATLKMLDRVFPKQLKMRSQYVGLGDTRAEMAARAARNRSPVYVLGDISEGIKAEARLYLDAGTTPTYMKVGEANVSREKKLSYSTLNCKEVIK